MEIRTHLGNVIEAIDSLKARYDKNVKELLADPQRRAEMGRNLRSMVLPDSTDRICDIVENLAKK